LTVFFALLGSEHIKAAHKILLKLAPDRGVISERLRPFYVKLDSVRRPLLLCNVTSLDGKTSFMAGCEVKEPETTTVGSDF